MGGAFRIPEKLKGEKRGREKNLAMIGSEMLLDTANAMTVDVLGCLLDVLGCLLDSFVLAFPCTNECIGEVAGYTPRGRGLTLLMAEPCHSRCEELVFPMTNFTTLPPLPLLVVTKLSFIHHIRFLCLES
jgi:hypothetical protein